MASLNTIKNGDVLIAYFTDAQILDEGKIQQISEELMDAANRAGDGKLLLNFKDVRFMSSSVLGRLVHLNKKCKGDKTRLVLCNISAEIMEVFKITRLNKVFDIYESEDAGLAALAKKW